MGLSAVSGGADGGGRAPVPRGAVAPPDPAIPDCRPFRHRPRPQERSRRAVRLAAARRCRLSAGGLARRPTLWPARDQLTGLVMADMPGAVLAYEQIAGDQGAAAELLFADDEGGIAVEEHPLVITDDARRLGVRQDAAPAVDDRLAVGERGPARMDAGDRRGLRP